MIENKNIVVIHESGKGYYPVDYLKEYKIGTTGPLKKGETVTKSFNEVNLVVPKSMKGIPDSDIVQLLNSAIDASLVFTDLRAAIYTLTEHGCWVRLKDHISHHILNLLNNNIDIAKNTKIHDDHRSADNPYTEIGLLGELATFERCQIAAIPGIGEKTMKLFDELIVKHRLYWGFSMDLMRDLGALT